MLKGYSCNQWNIAGIHWVLPYWLHSTFHVAPMIGSYGRNKWTDRRPSTSVCESIQLTFSVHFSVWVFMLPPLSVRLPLFVSVYAPNRPLVRPRWLADVHERDPIAGPILIWLPGKVKRSGHWPKGSECPLNWFSRYLLPPPMEYWALLS